MSTKSCFLMQFAYIPQLGEIINNVPPPPPKFGIIDGLVTLYTRGILDEKPCNGYIPVNGIIYIYIYSYILHKNDFLLD